jgi:hypothetical protein
LINTAMKKILIRTAIAAVLLVVIALAAVFFSLNAIVKKGVETVGPPMTKTDVQLGAAALSPFSGSGKLSTLVVGNPEGFTNTGYAIRLGSVAVALKLGSVLSDTVEVDSIDIEQPQISLEGTLNGNNLKKILDNLQAASASQQQPNSPPPPGEKKAKKFIVKDLVLNGAKVRIDISALNKSLDTTVPIPNIHLQNIGTGQGGVSAAELCRQLLDPLVIAAVKSAGDELTKAGLDNLSKQGVNDLKKSAQGALDNLLNKK